MRKTTILLVAVLSLAFVSCGKKAVVKKVDDPGVLYVEGIDSMNKKKYDKASESFGKIRENYPFDPMAVIAQVKQGDVHFLKKDYQLASGVYEEFVNSYPDDENTPYALKRLGECYEKLSPSIDRDQTMTFKAVERFTYLKNRYSASPYAKDVESHLAGLAQKLAARELYVGEFYYRSGNYNASIMRLDYFFSKYPEARDKDKALYYLAESYGELDNPEKRSFYLDKLKQDYPRSTYVSAATRGRKKLREAKAVVPTTVTAAKTASPVALSYDEKKKREIDLRPIGTPDVLDGKSVVEAASKEASKTRADARASESNGGLTAKTTSDAQEEAATRAPEKAEEKGLSRVDGNAKAVPQTDRALQVQKKGGDGKDSLGFFSEKRPVDVSADTMEGLEKGKIIVFKGNVIARQEHPDPTQTLSLFSDKLTARMNQELNEIDKADAEGNVKMIKGNRTATCKQAFFDNGKGEVILKGDVVVFEEGGNRLTGDTVTYYINEDRFVVQGQKEKRARVIVTPK